MQCTCSIGFCEPHRLLTGPPRPRQALTPEHIDRLNRWEEHDFPIEQTHLTAAQTRLLFEAQEIQGALRTGDWPAA